MDTEQPSASIFNDPAILMLMQTLEQVASQPQHQPQLQQHQIQQQQQQQQIQQAPNLEQILQQVSVFQAIQELVAQQQQQQAVVGNTQMVQEDEEDERDEGCSDQNTLQQSQQHQIGIHQFTQANQRSHSPPSDSMPLNLLQASQCNQDLKASLLNTNFGQSLYSMVDKQQESSQNNGNKNTLLSPSLTSVNISQNQDITSQTSKGRSKKETNSTIRIKQQSNSLMEVPLTPSQLPIIPEIIIPTAQQCSKTIPNINNNINNNNLPINDNTTNNNNNINNSHSSSAKISNNFNFDLDSFNLGVNANMASMMTDNNNGNQLEEAQLMNLLTSCFSIEQLVQLALTNGNGQNNDNTQAAAAAALALIMNNGGNTQNGCNTNQNYVDTFNNDSGEENAQNQMYAKYQHLMNTPTQSHVFNSNAKTAFNTSNVTSKTQQSNILSNGNNNQNIFHNITTNLSSFFDMSGFNSGEKKALSPTSSSRQTTSFIPHIISHSNGINNNQSQLPSQQLNFSQMGNLINSIDPTALSFQALMAQHTGIDTPDLLRLREQKRLERQFKIERYKNKRRNWIRKISYDCRKRVADSRLRVKGRFISKKDSEKLKQRPDDSSYQQENMMAAEQGSQNESNNNNTKLEEQNNQDCENIDNRQYMDENAILHNKDVLLLPQHQNSSQNPENIEFEEVNNNNNLQSPQKGFEIQMQSYQNNQENSQNLNEDGNVSNHCELTCAASMNPNSILANHLIKPDVMEKVKQRISDKKPLFSLISHDTPQKLVLDFQNNNLSTSSTSSSTSKAALPIVDNTKNSKVNVDLNSYQSEQKQLIEA